MCSRGHLPGAEGTAFPDVSMPHVVGDKRFCLRVKKRHDSFVSVFVRYDAGPLPCQITYELLVKHRRADEIVYRSDVHTYKFTKHEGYGLRKFRTLGQLAEKGAYDPAEDCITFGVILTHQTPQSWMLRGQNRSLSRAELRDSGEEKRDDD